ncbi:hypothetical protein XA68_11487 [Ophiocordyceps unilateralis]|uniref:BRCT domain-containing protein n=1 Tax=Ophiocordyceps unilateralis TaxID=268505 RepID=A0A2A9PFD2_OPHUN|nr:hypothetical protein XA68_11487 [Ophiocordyceps unilateralis]
MALNSIGESQDSQAILDAHRALFRAGSMLRTATLARGNGNERLGGASPALRGRAAVEPWTEERMPAAEQANANVALVHNSVVKMDTSQQTPTQANEDRDYSAFCELTDEPRTLVEGDTGAVHFADLRPSSQLSEDAGLDTTRSDWRVCGRGTSQPCAKTPLHSGRRPPPATMETPDVCKNPFAAEAVVSAPLAGSQLFGTTQLLSSAAKAVSPTSSRPWPHADTNAMDTTLERGMQLTSSPLRMTPSSPVPRKQALTSPAEEEKKTVGETDLIKDDLIIPESPTASGKASKPTLSRGPSAHYEPMKKSQERKTRGDAPRQPSPYSDYDDVLQRADRRRRAEKKRAQAAEEMEKICFARTSKSKEEQPRKRRRLRSSRRDASGDDEGEAPATKSVQATPGEEPVRMEAAAAEEQLAARDEEDERIPATSPMDVVDPSPASSASPTASVATTASRGRRLSPASAPRRSLRAAWSTASLDLRKRVLGTGPRSESLSRRWTDGALPECSSRPGRRAGVFDNMVFALSSQSDKQRKKLETQIVRAGGRILDDGFQSLFIQDDHGLELGPTFCGFVALIADAHSRKAKFMEALALGLPCLSQQWITACLRKGEAIDWEPYLLCAGASAVLGNAIRSRVLETYPASCTQLADVFARRRRLLKGQSVLVLLSKTESLKKKRPREQLFLFLVRAMAPDRLLMVTTPRQRREVAREAASFDWVYGGEGEEGSGTRVLTDELVIQSLILGRMVEVGEM